MYTCRAASRQSFLCHHTLKVLIIIISPHQLLIEHVKEKHHVISIGFFVSGFCAHLLAC
jgi:hypothetical protein